MATRIKLVFIQHDMDSFTGTFKDESPKPFYVYGDKVANDAKTLCSMLVRGSALAFQAFPNKKVQTDVDSAKTSMGVAYMDDYTGADSITWSLNDDKTELTMLATFSSYDACMSFQNQIESKSGNDWSSIDTYQDKAKGEYVLWEAE